LKALEKNKQISEDELKDKSADVQKLTDDMIKDMDAALKHKEAEIMQV